MKTLRDYGTNPPLGKNPNNTTSPTTPLPETNPQWHQTTDKQQIPHYECKDNLVGLSLCEAALSYGLNNHLGTAADAIAISNLHLPEIQREHLARYSRPFNGMIPYLYGPGPQIKWVRVDINGSMPRNLVFLSVHHK